MNFRTSLLAVTAVSAVTGPALAQETTVDDTLRFLQRVATQYVILATRLFVDLTYDRITVEPGTGDLIVGGLRIFPELEWDPEGLCTIGIERAVIADANSLDELRASFELSGVVLPAACFDPGTAAIMADFGYDGLTAEAVSVDFAYHIPSSAADLMVQAAVVDAAEFDLAAHFDYLWVRFPVADSMNTDGPTPEPTPVARLGTAELVIENRGLWEALEPMIAMQVGDVAALPDMVQAGIGELFTEGGTRRPTPEESAFVDNLATEIGRFVAQRDRIVLTAAPDEGSVLLTTELLDSPGALIAALDPVLSATPRAYRLMVSPDELAAALAGSEMEADARMRIGEALITGVGAPRAIDQGRLLLMPLAEQWDAAAALLAARAAAEAGDDPLAYLLVLRALPGDGPGARALADQIEAELPLATVLSAQTEAAAGWPGAGGAKLSGDELIAAGDVPAMRRRAYAAAEGRARPRDYGEAYYWATLAAAAGDRAAASLRQRLDARFAERGGWASVADARAAEALETWANGLGETLAARAR